MTHPASYDSTQITPYRKMGMAQSNILEQLKHPRFEGFLEEFRPQSFSKGQLISLPGSSSNEVFVVASGRVRVYLAYDDREFTLCYLEEGDIFSSHTRAFVAAAKDSSLLMVSAREFGRRVKAFPELSMLMTDILGDVLTSTLDIIDGLIFFDVRHRLIRLLLSLALDKGSPTTEGLLFCCDYSMEDIARLVGTSRQTASSLLNNLIRDGYIVRTDRNHFRVPSIDQLQSLLKVSGQ